MCPRTKKDDLYFDDDENDLDSDWDLIPAIDSDEDYWDIDELGIDPEDLYECRSYHSAKP